MRPDGSRNFPPNHPSVDSGEDLQACCAIRVEAFCRHNDNSECFAVRAALEAAGEKVTIGNKKIGQSG